jgi:hypothetical protein
MRRASVAFAGTRATSATLDLRVGYALAKCPLKLKSRSFRAAKVEAIAPGSPQRLERAS